MSLETFGFQVLILTTGVQYTWEKLVATTEKKSELEGTPYLQTCMFRYKWKWMSRKTPEMKKLFPS